MAGVLFPIHVTLSFLELRESKQKSNDSGTRKHPHPAYEQSLINTVRAGRRQPETDPSSAVDSASGGPGFLGMPLQNRGFGPVFSVDTKPS